MALRSFMLFTAVAVLAEVLTVKYWIDNAGFDCWPRCDTGQVVSGWTIVILPIIFLVLLAFSLTRWVRSR